jgi:hypothetical protein
VSNPDADRAVAISIKHREHTDATLRAELERAERLTGPAAQAPGTVVGVGRESVRKTGFVVRPIPLVSIEYAGVSTDEHAGAYKPEADPRRRTPVSLGHRLPV